MIKVSEKSNIPIYQGDFQNEKKVSFASMGHWKIFEDIEIPDERIAEFHLGEDAFFYKWAIKAVNSRGLQAMMNKGNVLIFFKDKKPILGRPVAPKGYRNSNVEEVAEFLYKKLKCKEGKELEILNQFPLVNMSDLLLLYDSTDFVKYSSEMMGNLIKNEEEVKTKDEFFPSSSALQPESISNDFGQIANDVVKDLVTILYSVGSYGDDMEGQNMMDFVGNSQSSMSTGDRKSFVDSIVNQFDSNSLTNQSDMDMFVVSLRFLALKCVTEFFVFNKNDFFNGLFKGYNTDEPENINQLFQNLPKKIKMSSLVTKQILMNLNEFPSLDKDAIEKIPILSKEEYSQDPDISPLNMVVLNCSDLIFKIYGDIYDQMNSFIINSGRNGTAPEHFRDSNTFSSILIFLISKHFLTKYFSHIQPIIEFNLSLLDLIENKKLQDITVGGNFQKILLLRRYLRTAGYVDFDQKLDSSFLSYEEYPIFEKVKNRLILV